MPHDFQGPSRPSSRFLHHPKLRDEVFSRLQSHWPSGEREWGAVRDHLRDRLNLPEEFFSTAAEHPMRAPLLPTAIAPPAFEPESVETPDIQLESIILPLARPVIFIQDNDFGNSPLAYWQERLNPARDKINASIVAVGRIELKNHDLYEWNGTAWLVRSHVAVTNAHVARAFAAKQNDRWVFRTNAAGKKLQSKIDFREEYDRPNEEELEVIDILYVEEGDGPDIALLQVQADPARGNGIALAKEVSGNTEVATIGYPKFDSSVPDPDVLVSIFGGIYDVKRLSPGVVTVATPKVLKHDCSTLGGNSGSTMMSLASGEAVGLHFGGSYKISNFAVPAPVISALLTKLGL